MATRQMSEVIRHLRGALLLRDGAGLTDGQLLEDYLGRRDEAALAALVRRHGPMVWGVCRRLLRNHHDAEDAFQATFLVLVRRAASIASPGLLANWLYGVAHQTARKARAAAAKRATRERQVATLPEPAAADPDPRHDLRPLLDQALSRLPDKYRVAIILCDLEGKSRRQAAGQLGVPEGTLAARLARGRALLARRLARRGLALPGGVLTLALSQQAAWAGVPGAVVTSTIHAASPFAAGPAAALGAVSPRVAALTEGVLRTMFIANFKSVGLMLLAALALGIGVCLGPQPSGATGGGAAALPKQEQAAANTGGGKQPARQVQTKKVEKMPGVVHGVLDEVDAQKNRITVTLPGVMGIDKNGVLVKGESIRLENLPVGKGAKVTVNGKEAKFAEVNPRMHATLELEVSYGRVTVKSIEAKDGN